MSDPIPSERTPDGTYPVSFDRIEVGGVYDQESPNGPVKVEIVNKMTNPEANDGVSGARIVAMQSRGGSDE